jgi:hypothetical protein
MYDNHIIKDRLNSKKGVVFQPPSKKPEDFVSLYEKNVSINHAGSTYLGYVPYVADQRQSRFTCGFGYLL